MNLGCGNSHCYNLDPTRAVWASPVTDCCGKGKKLIWGHSFILIAFRPLAFRRCRTIAWRIPSPSNTITHGTDTHIEMDRQSRACRRVFEAKPSSDPKQQPPNRHYVLEDNTITWMRTHAGELPIPRSQKAARSEWSKRMKGVKRKGTANEAVTEEEELDKRFPKSREGLLSRVWASSRERQ